MEFYGRTQELADLRALKTTKAASLVVLKGRRRVGKSTLVEELAKHFDHFYQFVGLPPEENVTAHDQKKEFARKLEEYTKNSHIHLNDWAELFESLHKLSRDQETLIFLDEIAWMGKGDATFLPKLKTVWATVLKQNSKLVLIICSSISSWIDKNLLSSTGFVGRITLEKQIDPLPLKDCLKFWGDKKVSKDEKLEFLTATGGIPRYLEELRPSLTSEANIRNLFFRKDGLLFNEFDNIFSDLFAKTTSTYKQLMQQLATSAKSQTSLAKEKPEISSAHISRLLEDLVTSGFIARDYTWNINKPGISRLSKYRISDSYTRFYLQNVLPNRQRVLTDLTRNINLHRLPHWYSTIGLGMENLILSNRNLIRERLDLSPDHIVLDGPFFQPRTKRQSGCQIDYLIETFGRNVYLCEIKYSSSSISDDVINQMNKSVNNIVLPKRTSLRTVLIHFGQISDKVKNSETFDHIIDFADFLE